MAHELTFEQIQETKRIFDQFKNNNDDNVEEAKMKTNCLVLALSNLKFEIGQEEVNEIIVNMNLPSEIDFPTFLRIAAIKFKQVEFVKELESAFKAFDKNNKEYLTFDELRSVLTDFGPKLPIDKADGILKELGLETNKKFKYKDFIEKNI